MRRIGFTGSVLLLACMLGCGDDDSGGTPDAGSDSGAVSGTGATSGGGSGSGGNNGSTGQSGNGSAGSGGSSAGNGSGGMSGSGSGGNGGGTGGFMMTPVMCGSTTCMAPMGARLPSCCLPDMTCGGGFMGECQSWNQPGTLDATCPSHMISNTNTLQGCCKPNNQCGVMSRSGLGCVERTELAMFAGGPLDAMACGQSGDDGGNDGG